MFDVGVQTARAIRAIAAGTPALQAASADSRANGNGSLMRALPLALWHRGPDADLVASGAAAALRATIAATADPTEREADEAELELHIRPDDASPGHGGGYVDCLRSARWAVAQGDYERVVKVAIALGGDTDTTACVAGGIAGVSARGGDPAALARGPARPGAVRPADRAAARARGGVTRRTLARRRLSYVCIYTQCAC